MVPGPRDSHVGDDSLTIRGPPTGHLGRTLGPRPLLRPAWVWLGAREQGRLASGVRLGQAG